jgi:diguanylate cyclase (GGDEF)-like protein
MAFVFIDIDHFKEVNDTFGHEIGDALLVNFVKRIRNSLPEQALVARIAGDEFAILLKELKDESHLTDLMNEVFSSMKRPFSHQQAELAITCSAGCVLTDGSEQPDEVMRVADKVMYQAKHEGRARFLVKALTPLT